MTSLRIGVIVCAYTLDRRDDIVRAVESLELQEPRADEVVLVIDHNDDLLRWARGRWPHLNVIENAGEKGLSGARNTGLDALHSDIAAFLDDDAAARPGWITHLSTAYADPDVAAIGGRAIPVWPGAKPPAVLPPELLWVVGCTYLGQPTEVSDVRNVMGCSMSFRRAALAEVGGFLTGVGRVDTLPLGCEETELCIRLRQRDRRTRIVYDPAAVVDHRVSAARLGWSYLVRRSYAEGLSKAIVSKLAGANDGLSVEREYTRRVLPRGVLRELRQGRPAGAAAIVVSLACAAFGLLRGRTRKLVVGAPPTLAPIVASD